LIEQGQLMSWNAYVHADAFPGPISELTSQTITYDGTSEHPKKFPGTFDGVAGQYSCTSADNCTVVADGEGVVTAVTGDWTFIPAYLGPDGVSTAGTDDEQVATREDDLTEPSVAVDDTDYLQFGWWTEMDDGDVEFQTFFGGGEGNDFAVTNIDGLEGTATYKGPAAGRYAVKAFNANATIDSIRHGVFTAAATLTANFGGTSIAEDDQFSISGAINGFESENDDDLSAWRVELKQIDDLNDLGNPGDMFSTEADMVGVDGALAGSPVTSGDWKGAFFGDPAADNAVGDAAHPGAVAGEFNAESSHGAVAGAFGAENTR
jgi:hypothetical protein